MIGGNYCFYHGDINHGLMINNHGDMISIDYYYG